MRFIETLQRFKDKCQYQIYGYCLMNNHIHLLLKEEGEPISLIIKRISSSYVYWFNQKYERNGHLFQERFKSENVEDRAYFLTVLRYIHQNPLKAGLAQNVFDSPWTSIHDYIHKPELVAIDFAISQFSAEKNEAVRRFITYMQQLSNDICFDQNIRERVSDRELKSYMREHGVSNTSVLQQMDRESRNEILRKLKQLNGVSGRQLSRVTGVSKSVIQRL